MLTSSLVAVATQLLLGLVLGAKWGFGLGVLGVAIAYCASITITNLIGMVLVHRKLQLWTFASLNWRTVVDAFEMLRARVGRKIAVSRP
jgi:Na+-driven multidrug efflux pump